MNKFVIALLVTLTLTMTFAVPVSADQPDEPGAFGKDFSDTAQAFEYGLSTIIQDIHRVTESQDKAPGEVINWVLEEFYDIPPSHTP
ncbi:hypothetical protein ACFLY3_02925 [Chloroflexota bacterium]